MGVVPSPALLFVPSENNCPGWTRVAASMGAHAHVSLSGRKPARRQSPGDLQIDLEGHLTEWAPLPVHVLAQGAGCEAAVRLALQHPRQVRSLTLVDPVDLAPPQVGAGEDAQLERLLQWLHLGHGNTVREGTHLTFLQQKVAEQTLAGWEPAPAVAPALVDRLGELQCPVMALVGLAACPETKALAATQFGQAPYFQMRLVTGAAEQCALEAPGAVAELARRFLESLYAVA